MTFNETYIWAFLVVFIPVVILLVYVFVDSGKRVNPKTGKKLKRSEIFSIPEDDEVKKIKNTKTYSQYSQTSFDDFIAGRMSLAKCFWFYHVLIGFVLAFLCAYFAEMHQQYWLYIFPLAYYAVVTVAVWNCATLYGNEKLQNKQPYGWAIAAKIFISFNAIVFVGQTIVILSAK